MTIPWPQHVWLHVWAKVSILSSHDVTNVCIVYIYNTHMELVETDQQKWTSLATSTLDFRLRTSVSAFVGAIPSKEARRGHAHLDTTKWVRNKIVRIFIGRYVSHYRFSQHENKAGMRLLLYSSLFWPFFMTMLVDPKAISLIWQGGVLRGRGWNVSPEGKWVCHGPMESVGSSWPMNESLAVLVSGLPALTRRWYLQHSLALMCSDSLDRRLNMFEVGLFEAFLLLENDEKSQEIQVATNHELQNMRSTTPQNFVTSASSQKEH